MSPTFRSLRSHNYRLYLAGSVVSNVGTWMQRIAQDWLVLSLGGGGAALGITTGLQFLPILLLSPYAGVIADRFPKRRLLQVAQAWMALMSLLLGVLAVSGNAEVWMVYLVAFLFGIGAAFDGPGRQSFVSEMVHPDDVTNAVGLNSASFNLARLVGPALAGLLIGWLGGGPRRPAGSSSSTPSPTSPSSGSCSGWTPASSARPTRSPVGAGCCGKGSATSVRSPRC